MEQTHPKYGPCDALGPEGRCSECTGLLEGQDGSWWRLADDFVVKKPPLLTRLKAAWQALRG